MKQLSRLVGLLILGLVVNLVTADISLKLKNQQYLPPVQNSQISSNQRKFEDAKYGNPKYIQFEIHNEVNPNNRRSTGSNNKNTLNSPSPTEEIRIEHINAPPGFPLDNPDFDASLLNVASEGGNGQIILKHENVATTSTPNINVAGPFPSNYQHDFPVKESENFIDYPTPQKDLQTNRPTPNVAQNSQYLPPHDNQQYSNKGIENAFQGSQDILPSSPSPESRNNVVTSYKSPNYLPPHGVSDSQPAPFRPSQYLPPDDEISPLKGPDYLPPHQTAIGQPHQLHNSNTPFKAPGYLPPSQNSHPPESFQYSKPSNGAGQQGSSLTNNPLMSGEYLPPRKEYSVNDAGFKAPGYLPPGYDFQKPANSEDAIAELHTLPEQTDNNQNQHHLQVTVQSSIQVAGDQGHAHTVYGAPQQSNGFALPGSLAPQSTAYLPPGGQQIQSTASPVNLPLQSQSSGYLPPGYDFQKPPEAEQTQAQNYQGTGVQQQQVLLTQSEELINQRSNYQNFPPQNFAQENVQSTYKGPEYLPPADNTAFKAPGYLPPTSSSPPLQSAQRTDQIFNGPGYLPPTADQQSGQGFKPSEYLPPTAIPQSASTQTFQGPGYLPPTSATPLLNEAAFKGSQYLPPITNSGQQISQQLNFKAPGYLPPSVMSTQAPPASQTTVLYPLSSYMTNVQPFERYASSRKPFAEYGLPPTQFVPSTRATEVAPMYREATSRPQYYAPTMSYNTNVISSQIYNPHVEVLSQQARVALESFMPQDIRQVDIPYTAGGNSVSNSLNVATPKVPVSAKVRTVQIINPNSVKTLKVLESLDHTGVKTIKILGPSNETPTGRHRVVKVVSGHEQTVQTVKIYSDQQDYTPSDSLAPLSSNNAYLPPRQKRNPKRMSHKLRQRAMGN